jgi:hypothetical protein
MARNLQERRLPATCLESLNPITVPIPETVPTVPSGRRDAQKEDPKAEEGVAWGLASTNPFMSPPGLQSRCPSCRFAEAAGPP